jgi:hypothetical protein
MFITFIGNAVYVAFLYVRSWYLLSPAILNIFAQEQILIW